MAAGQELRDVTRGIREGGSVAAPVLLAMDHGKDSVILTHRWVMH